MPKSSYFDWGQDGSQLHLALPRPASSPCLGAYVQLLATAAGADGPMGPGDVGIVLEDTCTGPTPFLVQELVSGRLWRYPECVLMRIPSCQVPEPFPYPAQPGEGSYVTLAHTYNSFSDAARGPLSLLMRDDDVYGIVLMESGRRFRVRCCNTGKDWWYDSGAIRPVHLRYVPQRLREKVRPQWGDYVALTGDHEAFHTEAGPLEAGNLGVVVAVDHCPDSQGGLGRTCYYVRACHNGRGFRYLEGALHLVVEQLLHLPKIPPTTALGRCKKLACNLTLLDADDAGLGAAGAAHGSGRVVPVTSVLCRGQSQLVQQVTPGRRYLIDARLSCKDEDLMLANLRVSSFTLYAPSGRPGQFVHLQPARSQEWQQQQWQQQQQRVPLSYCVHGNKSAAVAHSGREDIVWYHPCDDEVSCVFEWDSAETPLALKPGRVTDVQFVWGVCFAGLEDQQTVQHTLHLQTVRAACQVSQRDCSSSHPVFAGADSLHSRNAAAAAAAAGAESAESDRSARSVVFEWLDDDDDAINGNCAAASASRGGQSGSRAGGGGHAAGDTDTDDQSEEGGNSSNSSESNSDHGDDTDDDELSDSQQDQRRQQGHEFSNGSYQSHGISPNSSGMVAIANNSSGSISAASFSSCTDNDVGGQQEGDGLTSAVTTADECWQGAAASAPGSTSVAFCSSSSSSSTAAAAAQTHTAAAGSTRAAADRSGSSCSRPPRQTDSTAGLAASGSSCGGNAASSTSSSRLDITTSSWCHIGTTQEASRHCAGRSGGGEVSGPDAAADVVRAAGTCAPSTPEVSSRRPGSGATTVSSSSSGSRRTGRSSGSRDGGSSRSNRTRPSSGRSLDAHPRSRIDQHLTGGSHLTQSTSAAAAAAAMESRHSGGSAGAAALGNTADLVGVSIQELMRQVQAQAESREPLWQEGTELAAALAAKAMDAAEEWQQSWQRTR